MIKKNKLFYIIIIFFLSFSNAIASQLEKIEIQGNSRISNDTIKMFSNINIGENIKDINLNEVLKNLYNTYFFEDVAVEIKDNSLIIVVSESPIIETIEIKGIKAKKIDQEIKDNLKLRSRSSYNNFLLSQDKKAIRCFKKFWLLFF